MAGVHRMRHLPVIMVVIMLAACAGVIGGGRQGSGVYHRVKKGETLYKIAQAYKVDIRRLAEANDIEDAEKIEAGWALFVPDAQQVIEDISVALKPAEIVKSIPRKPVRPVEPPLRKAEKAAPLPSGGEAKAKALLIKEKPPEPKDSRPLESHQPEKPGVADKNIFPPRLPALAAPEVKKNPIPPPEVEKKKERGERKPFLWPVAGKVVSRYGKQANGMFHNGIKIAAIESSPVVAAAAGIVIFSAPLKGYGETIILKHNNDYATVYAHLGRRLVKSDDHPQGGEKIATLSPQDLKGESALHFEVRHKNKVLNPLLFLP